MSQAYKTSAKTSPHQNRYLERDFTKENNYSKGALSLCGFSFKINKIAFKSKERKLKRLFRYIKKQVMVMKKEKNDLD